ncbi:YafY family protein [uncultured Roseobacter sp.]|uniref:helix-turn-helix transcriptional regulator n=1 Tax=uncultured Roseobacter sp. TaxID=114847 RepID=UPI00262D1C24|nr:YafY family protein [uncultured Roseobacter sp.]
MGKTSRFFEVIQLLRQASRPLRAQELADQLEVSKRTIYRDIATLQSMQTPIVGEPGIGYVMRKGYDLPPINFDVDEADAVAVGLSLVARTGDLGLWRAARRASRKLVEASPGTSRLVTSSWGVGETPAVDMAALRAAIRSENKIALHYKDVHDHLSERIVWPLILIYYVDTAMLVAWCELRRDLRHFRLDRVVTCKFLDADFIGQSEALVATWEATQKHDTVSTQDL